MRVTVVGCGVARRDFRGCYGVRNAETKSALYAAAGSAGCGGVARVAQLARSLQQRLEISAGRCLFSPVQIGEEIVDGLAARDTREGFFRDLLHGVLSQQPLDDPCA